MYCECNSATHKMQDWNDRLIGIEFTGSICIPKRSEYSCVFIIGKSFFPKRLQKIKFKCPLDMNLKKPACASKQDGLILATLQYL